MSKILTEVSLISFKKKTRGFCSHTHNIGVDVIVLQIMAGDSAFLDQINYSTVDISVYNSVRKTSSAVSNLCQF